MWKAGKPRSIAREYGRGIGTHQTEQAGRSPGRRPETGGNLSGLGQSGKEDQCCSDGLRRFGCWPVCWWPVVVCWWSFRSSPDKMALWIGRWTLTLCSALLGTAGIGSELSNGTLKFSFSHPVSRSQIWMEKSWALALGIVLLSSCFWISYAENFRRVTDDGSIRLLSHQALIAPIIAWALGLVSVLPSRHPSGSFLLLVFVSWWSSMWRRDFRLGYESVGGGRH